MYAVVLALVLGACNSSPDSNPKNVSGLVSTDAVHTGVEGAVLLPGGNYSLVTVRRLPSQGSPQQIVCHAPSPDWASAITTAQSFKGSLGTAVGTSVSAEAANSLAETITAMVGRTSGVVALRDGLYKACEAYANGVIGKDAYALILSQYGNLLVALVGSSASSAPSSGDKSSSSTPSTMSGTPSGVAVAVSTGSATTTTTPAATAAPKSSTASSGSDSSSAQLGQMQLQMVQAMLVACISNKDRSVVRADQTNGLLDVACPILMGNIANAATKLLSPSSSGGGSGGQGGQQAKADPAIMALQTEMRNYPECKACNNLAVDGIDGPATQAALKEYQALKKGKGA